MKVLPVLAIAAVALGLAPAAGAQVAPTVTLERETGAAGEVIIVQGGGWEPQSMVNLEVCGNEARNGTPDCALGTSQITGTDLAGGFRALLAAVEPPTPCPCVVRVSARNSPTVVLRPVIIDGAPTAEPTASAVPAALRRLTVTSTRVEGGRSWTSWFGAGPSRALVVDIENTGPVPVEGAELLVSVGKGDAPTGQAEAPVIPRLEPGEEVTVRVPVELDALAFGSYTVAGRIANLGTAVPFRTTTSHYPWGLLAIAVVIAQLGLLRLRDRARRRVHAAVAGDCAPEPPEQLRELPPAPAAVAAPPVTGLALEGEIDLTETCETPRVGLLRSAATQEAAAGARHQLRQSLIAALQRTDDRDRRLSIELSSMLEQGARLDAAAVEVLEDARTMSLELLSTAESLVAQFEDLAARRRREAEGDAASLRAETACLRAELEHQIAALDEPSGERSPASAGSANGWSHAPPHAPEAEERPQEAVGSTFDAADRRALWRSLLS